MGGDSQTPPDGSIPTLDGSEEGQRRIGSPATDLVSPSSASADGTSPLLVGGASEDNVLKPDVLVKKLRTDVVRCTNSEHLGMIGVVPATANDVVRRYLANLMKTGRVEKKATALAKAMGTSRTQVYASIAAGTLTVDHVNALAKSLDSSVSAVWSELAGLAKLIDGGEEEMATNREYVELLGRQDRRKAFISDSPRESHGDGRPSDADVLELPSKRPR